jgi:hypothetical protein
MRQGRAGEAEKKRCKVPSQTRGGRSVFAGAVCAIGASQKPAH